MQQGGWGRKTRVYNCTSLCETHRVSDRGVVDEEVLRLGWGVELVRATLAVDGAVPGHHALHALHALLPSVAAVLGSEANSSGGERVPAWDGREHWPVGWKRRGIKALVERPSRRLF